MSPDRWDGSPAARVDILIEVPWEVVTAVVSEVVSAAIGSAKLNNRRWPTNQHTIENTSNEC